MFHSQCNEQKFTFASHHFIFKAPHWKNTVDKLAPVEIGNLLL
jgi:hypothetical protein